MVTRNGLEQRFRVNWVEVPACPSIPGTDEEHALAQAIVDTIREPLLILDRNLHVVAANRAFCLTFKIDLWEVQDQPFFTLGAGQWNIPELKLLLANILPHHMVMEAYEVAAVVPGLGPRTLLLNVRPLLYGGNDHRLILLTFEDITARRAAERETAALLQQKEILLREMQHRVANSLQIIASILLLKARSAGSDDSRLDLQDAYRRILSVAAVQQHLDATLPGEQIELAPHLSRLCKTLGASLVSDDGPVTIEVLADGGAISSREIVSIGLIVTELVINALKHAFAADTAAALIVIAFEASETGWRLMVSDNGVGMPDGGADKKTSGLGMGIVETLARQLDARVERAMGLNGAGTSVSITHGSVRWTGPCAAESPLPLTAVVEQVAQRPLIAVDAEDEQGQLV